MAITIRQLIAELQEYENLDQPIIGIYWTADTFEFGNGTATPTPEDFAEIIDVELRGYSLGEVDGEIINDAVFDFMNVRTCEQCNKRADKIELETHEGVCMDCNAEYGSDD